MVVWDSDGSAGSDSSGYSIQAQRFGASRLTFFDDEVTEFFSPHAAGKSVMFLVALGHPDRAALGLASWA